MKSQHISLKYYKLISYEANILPIEDESNDFCTTSFETNSKSDFLQFIHQITEELQYFHADNKDKTQIAYIIANYLSIFKREHSIQFATLTLTPENKLSLKFNEVGHI